jgi:hypothetical protein
MCSMDSLKSFNPKKKTSNLLLSAGDPVRGIQDSVERTLDYNKKGKSSPVVDDKATLVASDPEVQAAMERERRLSRLRKGRQATILTSGNQQKQTLG